MAYRCIDKSLIIILCVSQIYALAKLECLNYWVTAPIHCSYQTNTGRNRGIGSFNYWQRTNAVTADIDGRIGSKPCVRAHADQRGYWRRGITAFGHSGHRRIISSTLLTLVVLPVLFRLVYKKLVVYWAGAFDMSSSALLLIALFILQFRTFSRLTI